ncbi:carboxypeptidase-like regulatory domain-containing protein [Flavobacterium cerinum]|uniref:Carboxypeptidase-like regulatory domain-containing protein n=1 Tax=Flavobacterium cerinum TaxID=2502784 RepID=A0ABY5IQ28_9FLAO|nr:carboxypeptidase-like regulatory domain-containing protein [Flavobacterium cerinum]UUC44759.1 carboxypeptidase-like regulatory domain-containing protein [Flavobacterium cerinum]
MIFSRKSKILVKKIILFKLLFFTVSFYSQETDDGIKKKSVENSIFEHVEISGIVSDLEPLSNVVVLEKGKGNFVMTDNNGKFTIKIPLKNFKDKVFLRFEVLNLNPKEIEILPNTKYIKAQLNNYDNVLSKKWKIEFVFEKPDISNLIFKTLDFITTKH